jgi:hypothetical protein
MPFAAANQMAPHFQGTLHTYHRFASQNPLLFFLVVSGGAAYPYFVSRPYFARLFVLSSCCNFSNQQLYFKSAFTREGLCRDLMASSHISSCSAERYDTKWPSEHAIEPVKTSAMRLPEHVVSIVNNLPLPGSVERLQLSQR